MLMHLIALFFIQVKSQKTVEMMLPEQSHYKVNRIPEDELYAMKWNNIISDLPNEWYGSKQAVLIAENVVLYQRYTGGWPKNIPMHHAPKENETEDLLREKNRIDDSTIDNDATTQEMIYLANVYQKTKIETFRESFLKGLDYLLEAQYENGGWPQFYPLIKGYYSCITYNDNAMMNVMELLKTIADKNKTYDFVRPDDADRCLVAFNKGVDCILKTQYLQNGELTVWCAQHDPATLAPAKARAYELPSLSGAESVGIVLFLKKIKNPSAEITNAINAAEKWFKKVCIYGIKLETYVNDEGQKDRRVIQDPEAGPIWGRFYELENNRPFFCDRDGIKKYSLSEIGYERRTGYGWYTAKPLQLLLTIPEN
jgi:pectinesterase